MSLKYITAFFFLAMASIAIPEPGVTVGDYMGLIEYMDKSANDTNPGTILFSRSIPLTPGATHGLSAHKRGWLPVLNSSRNFASTTANGPLTIDGQGHSLECGNLERGFFVRGPGSPITIQNITINQGRAKGGSTAGGGGGGMGAGAGLYVASGAQVILNNVNINNCHVIGGDSDTFAKTPDRNGGGGGLHGNGGKFEGGGGGFYGNGGVGQSIASGAGGGGGAYGNGGDASINQSASHQGGGGGGGFASGLHPVTPLHGGKGVSESGGGGAGDGTHGADGIKDVKGGDGGNGSGGGQGGTGAQAANAQVGGAGGGGAVGSDPGNAPTMNVNGGHGPGGGGGGAALEIFDPAAGIQSGGNGGPGAGGGGAGYRGIPSHGGHGGFGGGGGGGTANTGLGGDGGKYGGGGGSDTGDIGGKGGFGAGGGGSFQGTGGASGFGAGAGGGSRGGISEPGQPGFAGGHAGITSEFGGVPHGGGGAALGSAIFLEYYNGSGAKLIFEGQCNFHNNQATSGQGYQNGTAIPSDIFMMEGCQIIFQNLTNNFSLDGSKIAGDGGAGGGTGGGLTLGANNKNHSVILAGNSTYGGTTKIQSGILFFSPGATLSTPVAFTGPGRIGGDISLTTITLDNQGAISTKSVNGVPLTIAASNIELGKNGGGFDVRSESYKLAKPLVDAPYNTGTFIITGDDSVYLIMAPASHSYTGATIINSGTVKLQADIRSSREVIINGGTLDLEGGKTRKITVETGGTLSGQGNIDMSLGLRERKKHTPSLARNTPPLKAGGAIDIKSGGELVLNGGEVFLSSSTGDLTIESGGTLRGRGSINGDLFHAGTISIGPEIDVLTVNGDYHVTAPDARFIVTVDPSTKADLKMVSGIAHIDGNGIVELDPLPWFYAENTTYKFLAAQDIEGKFAGVKDISGFGFILEEPSGGVYSLKIPVNEIKIALSIDELSSNAAEVGLYLLGETGEVFSPDLIPSLTALTEVSCVECPGGILEYSPQQFGGMTLAQLQNQERVGRSLNRASEFFAMQYVSSRCEKRCESNDGIWLNPLGYHYGQSPMQGQVGFNANTYGFTTGYTKTFNEKHHIVSVGGGYASTRLNWRENKGDATIQSIYLGPSIGYADSVKYAGIYVMGSRTFYDVDRNFRLPGIKETAHNNHRGWNLIAGFDAGVKWKMPEAMSSQLYLVPSIKMDYLNIYEQGYQESGAGPIGLSVRNVHSAYLSPRTDLKLMKEVQGKKICALPGIYLGYVRHIPLTDGKITSRLYKQQAHEKNFTVRSCHKFTQQLVLGAELPMCLKECFNMNIKYEANIGDHYNVQEGSLDLRYTF